MGGSKWTPEEDAVLRELRATMTKPQLAQRLGRSVVGVTRRLTRLEVIKFERLPEAPPGYKFCRLCDTFKPLSEFHAARKSPDGRQSRCKPCSIRQATEWNRAHPETFHYNTRTHVLRKRYGLSRAQYFALRDKQGGMCAICQTTPVRFSVDHAHDNGRVRGLLCHKCNSALGLLDDDAARVSRAVTYLLGS